MRNSYTTVNDRSQRRDGLPSACLHGIIPAMTEHDLTPLSSPDLTSELPHEPAPMDSEPVAHEGDSVLLVAEDQKRTLIKLQRGQQWHSNRGFFRHDDLIGQPLGRMLVTQLGHAYLVLEPSTHDLIRYLKRTTQIIFSKDAAYLVQRLNLFPGRRVIEAGTGSGGFTLALARAVMPTGRVISYEERAPMSELAAKNLARFGLLDYVDLKVRNIADGFDERNADALFLDMREPWHHIGQAREALKGGGFFGALVAHDQPGQRAAARARGPRLCRPGGRGAPGAILQTQRRAPAAGRSHDRPYRLSDFRTQGDAARGRDVAHCRFQALQSPQSGDWRH